MVKGKKRLARGLDTVEDAAQASESNNDSDDMGKGKLKSSRSRKWRNELDKRLRRLENERLERLEGALSRMERMLSLLLKGNKEDTETASVISTPVSSSTSEVPFLNPVLSTLSRNSDEQDLMVDVIEDVPVPEIVEPPSGAGLAEVERDPGQPSAEPHQDGTTDENIGVKSAYPFTVGLGSIMDKLYPFSEGILVHCKRLLTMRPVYRTIIQVLACGNVKEPSDTSEKVADTPEHERTYCMSKIRSKFGHDVGD